MPSLNAGNAPAPVLPVLSVASEMYPLVKTGGLADVVGALPAAIAPFGVEMRTLLPGYPAVLAALVAPREVARWPDWFGGDARLLAAVHGNLALFVLDAPHLYARPGNPYLDASGQDWPDNAERFAALSRAAARIALDGLDGFTPAVVHAHDWQSALVAAYLRYDVRYADGRRPATVVTLHNLAFQGLFDASLWPRLGLPDRAFMPSGVEYHGRIGFLKAGIVLADALTTVSPTYAREIRRRADGMGLDAMLRWRGSALTGIVNGIDTGVWNPATDATLAERYDVDTIARRAVDKAALEDAFGLPHDDGLLICMITRLTAQKGIDLVAEGLDAIVTAGARMVVLGTGDAALEDALRASAARRPDRIAVRIGYDEALSHRLQAGSDAILVPSRFEPCGLTQLYGLRYGCVPIVARVGGLADTVVDANDAAVLAGVATGIQFSDVSSDGVIDAVARAIRLYADRDVWRRMQVNGMRSDVGWGRSAAAYAALYRQLVA